MHPAASTLTPPPTQHQHSALERAMIPQQAGKEAREKVLGPSVAKANGQGTPLEAMQIVPQV
jgi:hypothetical protein